MNRYKLRLVAQSTAPDDNKLYVINKDYSGGVNTRQYLGNTESNQAATLDNANIEVLGESSKRYGSVLIGNDIGNISPVVLHNFEIQSSTGQLLMYENTTVWKWTGTGNWSSLKNNFTASTDAGIITCKESGLTPDDVVIVQNGINDAFRIDSGGNLQDLGNTNTSPPLTTVMCWYGNRVWCLLNDLLYFSDAYPADYSTAFDRTANSFRIPVGDEKKLIATRDSGIVAMGKNAIWTIFPSPIPAATDPVMPLVPNMGIVSKKAACAVGDDIYFFAPDGLHSLKRTVQDKLQLGVSYPISYYLKDEFEEISWAYIDSLSMEYFDNKLFISVPTGAATFSIWIYYPALNSFTVSDGWYPTCWARYKIGGQEFLYYGKQSQGKVYRAWYGNTDEGTTTTNGTAINYLEESSKMDFGQPLVKKCGGELKVKAKATGNYNLTVSASFNEGTYNILGTLNLTGNGIAFPVTFPINFLPPSLAYKKFCLDSYGEWYLLQTKIQHNATNDDKDITVLERSVVTYPVEYIAEEEV